MNITSNLHVTIVHLNELSGWSDEELQSFLSSWQYKSTKVKLTSYGLYKARDKDYFAGFNCFVAHKSTQENIRKGVLQDQDRGGRGEGAPRREYKCKICEKKHPRYGYS